MSILRNSLFLLATSLLLAAAVKSSEPEKPNVIVIYVDDVGWVDLESYGSEFYETPNIDSLLAQGLRFTQAYSNAPLCSPSRIGLLTGRHCARAKCYEVVSGKWDETGFFLRYGQGTKDDIIWDWEERVDFDPPHNNLDLPKDRKIMPEYLKELGYFTGFFGKWHVGPQKPDDRGFDEYASLQLFVKGAHLDVTKGRMVKTPDYPEPSGTSGDYMTAFAWSSLTGPMTDRSFSTWPIPSSTPPLMCLRICSPNTGRKARLSFSRMPFTPP